MAGNPGRGEKRAIWFRRGDPEWGALSNFAPSPFRLDGCEWPTVEHCFQAAKCADAAERQRVAAAPSPMAAKSLGRQARLRPDWDAVRDEVMRRALLAKFSQHQPSRERLLATRNRPLHEDAAYDRYWGGQGRDRLGRILMEVRDAVRAATG